MFKVSHKKSSLTCDEMSNSQIIMYYLFMFKQLYLGCWLSQFCTLKKEIVIVVFTDVESVELGASLLALSPKRMYVSCTTQTPAATNLQIE